MIITLLAARTVRAGERRQRWRGRGGEVHRPGVRGVRHRGGARPGGGRQHPPAAGARYVTLPHLHAANLTLQGATKPWALEQSVLYRRRSKCFYVVSFKFICFFGNFYKWGIVCLSVFLYDGWDVHKWVSFAAMPLRILFCLKCF